jgi:hypothetical protein
MGVERERNHGQKPKGSHRGGKGHGTSAHQVAERGRSLQVKLITSTKKTKSDNKSDWSGINSDKS